MTGQRQAARRATMRDKHAKNNGAAVRFEFRGKSGIEHAVDLHDRRLVRIVKACRDLPGHDLFQCVDEDGRHDDTFAPSRVRPLAMLGFTFTPLGDSRFAAREATQ